MGNTDLQRRNRKKKHHTLSESGMRAKRRRARKRIVIMQRIMLAVLAMAVIGGGGFAVVWNLPSVKLNRQLETGIEYTQEAAYDEAIEAYEHALEIDSTSVKAYRCMAGAYLDMEDDLNAKQILIEGWENTQDESLLQYYCTVILNEAVADINNESVSLETARKIIDVLEKGIMNEDAIELLYTAYDRIMTGEKEIDFTVYEQLMEEMFALSDLESSEPVKNIVSKYALIDKQELTVPMEHVASYLAILEKGEQLVPEEKRSDLITCLTKEEQIQEIFAEIFAQFDAGNYEAAKEFIITDTYTGIRDEFINGTMEYWNGATYIPVSREYVILKQTNEGTWTFEYPEFTDNESTKGIITVWGNPMKDNGVQRSCIAYEPAKESEAYYPHTEYVISYMYSNVQKKNSFDYMMNYHFETRTWTEEGMTTVMVGDWGGPYQWEKTY